jgi:hypothetical protein
LDNSFKLYFEGERKRSNCHHWWTSKKVVFDSNGELNIGNLLPKCDKLLHVFHIRTLPQIDLAYPQVVL